MEKVNTLTGTEKIVLLSQQVHPLGKGYRETAPKFPKKETTTSSVTFIAVSQQAPEQTCQRSLSAPTAAQKPSLPFQEQIPCRSTTEAAGQEPSELSLLASELQSLLQGLKEKPTPGYRFLATNCSPPSRSRHQPQLVQHQLSAQPEPSQIHVAAVAPPIKPNTPPASSEALFTGENLYIGTLKARPRHL